MWNSKTLLAILVIGAANFTVSYFLVQQFAKPLGKGLGSAMVNAIEAGDPNLVRIEPSKDTKRLMELNSYIQLPLGSVTRSIGKQARDYFALRPLLEKRIEAQQGQIRVATIGYFLQVVNSAAFAVLYVALAVLAYRKLLRRT